MYNPCTRIDLQVDLHQNQAPILQQAYLEVRDLLLEGKSRATKPGYTVFTHNGVSLNRVAHISTLPGDSLILGRHSRCDIVLPDDPSISLRHLLLRTQQSEEGPLSFEMLSLQAPLDLKLADGSLVASLQGEGIIAAQLGKYSIIAMPSDLIPNDLPSALPGIQTLGSGPADQSIEATAISRVKARKNPSHASVLPLSAKDAVGRVTIQAQGSESTLWLSKAQLQQGVVIGRYTRCAGGAIRGLFDDVVSRTHLLLCTEAGIPVAYDLASRNGVWRSGRRIRIATLTGPMTLSLGKKQRVLVNWEPTPFPS